MRIHILALLLFIQSLVACQQSREKTQVLTADLGLNAATAGLEQSDPPAANIVFQSTDEGAHWQDASAGLPAKIDIWSDLGGSNDVFLGAHDGLYHKTSSTGSAWEKFLFMYGPISRISAGKAGLYASSEDGGLFQNVPGTDVWNSLGEHLEDKKLYSILERSAGTLFVGTMNGIYKTVDNGKNWKQVFSADLIMDFAVSGDVLLAGGGKGILRSSDGGEHWNYTMAGKGAYRIEPGRTSEQFYAVLCTDDYSKPEPEGITNRLRASDDGGKSWHRLEQTPLPFQGTYDMDEDLAEAKDIYNVVQTEKYLFCCFNTGIFRSSDQGKTWEIVFEPKGKQAYRLILSGKVLYAVPAAGC